MRRSLIAIVTLAMTIGLVGPSLALSPPACELDPELSYKAPGSAAVYYVTHECTKRAFTRADIFFTYFSSWDSVQVSAAIEFIPDDNLGFMPWGPLYDPKYGALVKTVTDPKVYLLLNDEKYWITDEDVFNALNYQWEWIEDIDYRLLDSYRTGSEITDTIYHPNYTLVKYPNDTKVYRIEPHPEDDTRQVRRHIADEDSFLKLGFRSDRIVEIPIHEQYEDGEQLKKEPRRIILQAR